MAPVFDIFALALFVGTAAMFAIRFRHEDPPLSPYVVVCLAAAFGNWLGVHGRGLPAVFLMVSGAFLLLHLASLPYPEDREDAPRR